MRKKLHLFLVKNKKKKFVVLDIPLYFENKLNDKKDIIIEQSQWFTVDELQAGKALTFTFENEYEVKNKAKSLMDINRSKFTHKKMTELLNNVVDKYTESIPSQVSLNLPKLKKLGSSENKELPKIKLPKLKKVTKQPGVPA